MSRSDLHGDRYEACYAQALSEAAAGVGGAARPGPDRRHRRRRQGLADLPALRPHRRLRLLHAGRRLHAAVPGFPGIPGLLRGQRHLGAGGRPPSTPDPGHRRRGWRPLFLSAGAEPVLATTRRLEACAATTACAGPAALQFPLRTRRSQRGVGHQSPADVAANLPCCGGPIRRLLAALAPRGC